MVFLIPEEFAALLATTTDSWKPLLEFLVESATRWSEVTAFKAGVIPTISGANAHGIQAVTSDETGASFSWNSQANAGACWDQLTPARERLRTLIALLCNIFDRISLETARSSNGSDLISRRARAGCLNLSSEVVVRLMCPIPGAVGPALRSVRA